MSIASVMLERCSELRKENELVLEENKQLKQTLGRVQKAWFYDDIDALEECLYERGTFWEEANEQESHDLD